MALYLARDVKAGACTRMHAINMYRKLTGCKFITAVMVIDMAIGDLNEGNI